MLGYLGTTVRFFAVILILGLVKSLGAQDYVVLTTGDTLSGVIEPLISDYCSGIRLKSEGAVSDFTPSEVSYFEVSSFTKDGRVYVSGISKTKFVEKFVDGKVTFYEDDEEFYLTKDGRLFSLPYGNKKIDENGAPKEIRIDAWKQILKNVLSDCKGPQFRKIEKIQYPSRDYLTGLGREYNSCQGEEDLVTTSREKIGRVSIYSGYNVGSLVLDGNELYQIQGGFPNNADQNLGYAGINGGFRYGLAMNIFNKPGFMDSGIEIMSSRYVTNYSINLQASTSSRELTIDRTSLLFPIGFSLFFGNRPNGLGCFLHGLGDIQLSAQAKGKSVRTFDSGDVAKSNNSYDDIHLEPAQVGFRVGLIYVIPKEHSHLAASLSFTRLSDIITSVENQPVRYGGLMIHYYLQ